MSAPRLRPAAAALLRAAGCHQTPAKMTTTPTWLNRVTTCGSSAGAGWLQRAAYSSGAASRGWFSTGAAVPDHEYAPLYTNTHEVLRTESVADSGEVTFTMVRPARCSLLATSDDAVYSKRRGLQVRWMM